MGDDLVKEITRTDRVTIRVLLNFKYMQYFVRFLIEFWFLFFGVKVAILMVLLRNS